MKEITTIWVGLDVHKETIAVCALRGAAETGEEHEIRNEPELVRRFFKRLGKEGGTLRCCYEAGPCGYELRRQLDKMGIACEVIAPSLIPRASGDRVKTDRRDARKLAKLYRAGSLTTIHVPSEVEEAARDLVRCREDVTANLNRDRQRLIKFLLRHGRVWREGEHWTQAHWRWVDEQSFEAAPAQRTFEEYREQVRFTLERRSGLDRAVEEVAKQEPWRDLIATLRCLRGIDTLSALTILVEVQDFRRFRSPKELMSFVGLTPSLHESAHKGFRGSITKAGNTHVRRILIEASWHYQHKPKLYRALQKRMEGQAEPIRAHAMKAQRRLHEKYRKLVARGKPKHVAVVSVARELTGFIWALLVKYDSKTAAAPVLSPGAKAAKPPVRQYVIHRAPHPVAARG